MKLKELLDVYDISMAVDDGVWDLRLIHKTAFEVIQVEAKGLPEVVNKAHRKAFRVED